MQSSSIVRGVVTAAVQCDRGAPAVRRPSPTSSVAVPSPSRVPSRSRPSAASGAAADLQLAVHDGVAAAGADGAADEVHVGAGRERRGVTEHRHVAGAVPTATFENCWKYAGPWPSRPGRRSGPGAPGVPGVPGAPSWPSEPGAPSLPLAPGAPVAPLRRPAGPRRTRIGGEIDLLHRVILDLRPGDGALLDVLAVDQLARGGRDARHREDQRDRGDDRRHRRPAVKAFHGVRPFHVHGS